MTGFWPAVAVAFVVMLIAIPAGAGAGVLMDRWTNRTGRVVLPLTVVLLAMFALAVGITAAVSAVLP